MNEDTLMTTVSGEDDDIMLPSGWSEGDDIFAPESWSGAAQQADGSDAADEAGETAAGDSSDGEDALTMGEEDGGEVQSAGDEETDTPDGAQAPETKTPRKLKLKVNHEEMEVDIDEMPDEELIAHIQKSKAYDAAKEAENKRRYREIYQDQIDAGMTEAAAKMIAANEVDGKTYPLEDAPAAAAENAGQGRDIATDVAQLKALYPDMKQVPDEVAKAYAGGVPLLTAYIAYRERQSAKAAQTLRRENEVLKQNAAAAAKAPVRGVSGGAKAQSKPDPMLAGFDSDAW